MFSCVASEWFHLKCGFAKNHPVSAACAPRCLHCQAKPTTNRTRWLTSLGGSHRLVSSHPSRGFSVVYLSCLFFFLLLLHRSGNDATTARLLPLHTSRRMHLCGRPFKTVFAAAAKQLSIKRRPTFATRRAIPCAAHLRQCTVSNLGAWSYRFVQKPYRSNQMTQCRTKACGIRCNKFRNTTVTLGTGKI